MPKAEYSLIKDAPRSIETIVERKEGAHGREYRLTHRTQGWEPAGSMVRLREHDGWAVLFTLDDSTHGQWFRTETEARIRLALWTKV